MAELLDVVQSLRRGLRDCIALRRHSNDRWATAKRSLRHPNDRWVPLLTTLGPSPNGHCATLTIARHWAPLYRSLATLSVTAGRCHQRCGMTLPLSPTVILHPRTHSPFLPPSLSLSLSRSPALPAPYRRSLTVAPFPSLPYRRSLPLTGSPALPAPYRCPRQDGATGAGDAAITQGGP